jgi:hypothetical protein
MSRMTEAQELDALAAEIVARAGSDFYRIGRIMFQMSDQHRWACLTDPRTKNPYRSLEAWVQVRFQSGVTDQRATAFAAYGVVSALQGKVPDEVMEVSAPGSLKILAQLPDSAQKNPKIHELITSATVSEFTDAVIKRYPAQAIEKRIKWSLSPTMTQAQLYNRVLEAAQQDYGEVGTVLSREQAMEAIFSEVEQNMETSA